MANFRSISDDGFEPVNTKGRGQFSQIKPNEPKFMAEGIDYRLDDAQGEGIIKLNSVRTSLSNHAKQMSKKLGKKMTVKIQIGTEKETGVKGLRFTFVEKNGQSAQVTTPTTETPPQTPVESTSESVTSV